MITIIVISFVCVLNFVLWIVFFKKFNRLFSTDDIVNSTKSEIARMTDAMNRETSRDLRLIDDKLKILENAVSETEARFEELNEKMLLRLREYRESIDSPAKNTRYFERSANPILAYTKNSSLGANFSKKQENTVSDFQKEQPKEETVSSVEKNAEMPNITIAENPVIETKSFAERVIELSNQGLEVRQIARELGSSTTEVQLIIDMNF